MQFRRRARHHAVLHTYCRPSNVSFGARDYDASLGGWSGKDGDAWAGTANLYNYSLANPVNFLDLNGANPAAAAAGGAGSAASFAAAFAIGVGIVWTANKTAQATRCVTQVLRCDHAQPTPPPECDPYRKKAPKTQKDICDDCYDQCLKNAGKLFKFGDPWPSGCGGV